METQIDWLIPSDVEALYGFSKAWQSRARNTSKENFMPHFKLGSDYVFYEKEAIDRWIKSHAAKPRMARRRRRFY